MDKLKRKATLKEHRLKETGDCYEISAKLMLDLSAKGEDMSNYRLVHGEVTGQRQLKGMKIGHAWVEKKETFDLSEFDPNAHQIVVETVLDFSNGKDSNIPKGLYYAVGKIYSDEYDEENPFIRKSNTHIYTLEEMKKKIKEFGHWGCWDLVTETGL
tara:strand:- start:8 stop:478 length:471 start_codon:yes stop_codon:yes gene_type:complete